MHGISSIGIEEGLVVGTDVGLKLGFNDGPALGMGVGGGSVGHIATKSELEDGAQQHNRLAEGKLD
jgi:hypothetical protein